jgi:hypothetical protein
MLSWPKNWKLNLRYGRLKTAFRHFTLIGDGEIAVANPGYGTIQGAAAFFTIKVWASDQQEAVNMLAAIGRDVGFDASGEVSVYITDPQQPPKDVSYGYDLDFHQYIRD